MAQVLDSPLSSPLSARSVLSINIGSDPRLSLPTTSVSTTNRRGSRGSTSGAGDGDEEEDDPFAFHDSEEEDDNNNNNNNHQDNEEEEGDDDHHDGEQSQQDNYVKNLLLLENSSQLSFRSNDAASHSQEEILTQNAEFTQMTQDANDGGGSVSHLSPLPPRSPTMLLKVPWGRLMPLDGDQKKIDLLPKAPADDRSAIANNVATTTNTAASWTGGGAAAAAIGSIAGGSSSSSYSMLGLDQLKTSDLFNCYTLGRSNKCDIIAPKPNLLKSPSTTTRQTHDNNNSITKEQRLYDWAHGLISNRHCRLYCTLPEDPRSARLPFGSSSRLLPGSSMEVWIEDSSNNGTMINGHTLLKKNEKRRIHTGDEISLVNTETLRKKVRDEATLRKIQQRYSYVFVNVAHQQPLFQQQSAAAITNATAGAAVVSSATTTKSKPAPPIAGNIFQVHQNQHNKTIHNNNKNNNNSSAKRRKGLVNVRAMNYPPGSHSPLPTTATAATTTTTRAKHPPITMRSPLPSELGYGFAQPTPKSGNNSNSNFPSSFRRPPAGTARKNVNVQAAQAQAEAQQQQQQQQARRIELDYEVRDLLGRGTCGEVRRAIHRLTGKERAVKIISLPSPGLLRSSNHSNSNKQDDESQQWRKEADILRQLKHPYVVELVDVFITESHLYLVMELSLGGDLFDKIIEGGKYSEINSRRVMRRLLSALFYIHEDCQLVHRDLKPENILLASANDLVDVKITDFGVAKSATSDGLKTFCGTPSYIAPEVLKRRHTVMARGRYGKSADMWSLGCICYILLSGTTPYSIDGAAGMDVVLQSSCKIGFPESSWGSISPEAKDLVNKLLIKDPNKRITVQQAMEHKWILMEDGDTHRHPLEDPKLIAVTKKRLFSPHAPNGPTPVTSAASPHCKLPKAKKRKVSMEKSDVVFHRPSSPLGLSMAPIQRPLSPVNRCGSPSLSPPSSPSSFAKRLVMVKANNENDENRSEAQPLVEVQRPKPVTDTKARRQPKRAQKDGLVKAAELEEDRIQSQFSDEEVSISSFGNATTSRPSKEDAATGKSAPGDDSKKPTKKPCNIATKAVSSKAKKGTGATKKSKSSSGTSNKSSSKGSKSSDAEPTKITRWFKPKK